ncbi:MAG: helix-turn-helix domain-containing protein, partial [Planctomycetota bacterium]
NVIERAVVLCRGMAIEAEDILLTNLSTASESQIDTPTNSLPTYRPMTLEALEAKHIEATLVANQWNKSRAAAVLGIERSTLDRKIKRYGIKD